MKDDKNKYEGIIKLFLILIGLIIIVRACNNPRPTHPDFDPVEAMPFPHS